VAWEYLHRDGDWRKLEVLRDETRAFTRSGRLYFRGPAGVAPRNFGRVTADPVFWFRARLTSSQYERPPLLETVRTNTVPALAVTTVLDEVLGSSNGEPGQRFFLRNVPIHAAPPRSVDERLAEARARTAPPTEAEQAERDAALREREYGRGFLLEVDEGQGFAPWEEVEDFFASGPSDRHCVLSRASGEVAFGDRQRGAIPVAGVNNIVVRVHRHGGGARGNVGAGAISDLQTAVAGVDSVTNLWAAEGGADEEPLEDTKKRAPRELKARDRAVTGQDFELLARETPGARIRRAHALPLYHPQFPDVEVPGVLTIIVLPESDDPKPVPSDATLRAVCCQLNQHRLLTVEVHVAPPRYVEVRIEGRVLAAPSADPAQVKNGIEQALLDFLHPLKGGADGQGWPLGQDVLFSDIFRVAFGVPGVESVDDLRIVIDGERKGRCENAAVARDHVVFSRAHDVSVAFAAGR
jgi:predicted phage baseplate assembly protein